MAPLERLPQRLRSLMATPGHLQAPISPAQAQLKDHPGGAPIGRSITRRPQGGAGLLQQGLAPGAQRGQQRWRQGCLHHCTAQRLLTREADAIGREHARQRMQQHSTDAEPFG